MDYSALLAEALEERVGWLHRIISTPAPPLLTKDFILGYMSRGGPPTSGPSSGTIPTASPPFSLPSSASPPPSNPFSLGLNAPPGDDSSMEVGFQSFDGGGGFGGGLGSLSLKIKAPVQDLRSSIQGLRCSDLPLPACYKYLAAVAAYVNFKDAAGGGGRSRGGGGGGYGEEDTGGTPRFEGGPLSPDGGDSPGDSPVEFDLLPLNFWTQQRVLDFAKASMRASDALYLRPPPPPPPPPAEEVVGVEESAEDGEGRWGGGLAAGAGAAGELLPSVPSMKVGEALLLSRLSHPDAADFVQGMRKFIAEYSAQDFVECNALQQDYDLDWDAEAEADRVLLETGVVSGEGGDGSPRRPPPPATPPPPPPPQALHAFLTKLEGEVKTHPLWRIGSAATPNAASASSSSSASASASTTTTTSSSSSSSSQQNTLEPMLEALERLIMGAVHTSVFAAHPRCSARDEGLSRRLASLSFITHTHLDLPPPSPALTPLWALAQTALCAMSSYPAPGDKLTCIQSACTLLSVALSAAGEEGKKGGGGKGGAGPTKTVGADEFLPALIYTVIQASPTNLYSQLKHIADFRPQSKLGGEQGYYFINVMSAVQFARRAKAKDFSIASDEEFLQMRREALERWEMGRGGGGGEKEDPASALARLLSQGGGGEGGRAPSSLSASPAASTTGAGVRAASKWGSKAFVEQQASVEEVVYVPPPPQGPRFLEGLSAVEWDVKTMQDAGELAQAQACVYSTWKEKLESLGQQDGEPIELFSRVVQGIEDIHSILRHCP